MSSNIQIAYGTPTALTITVASLASSLLAGRESTAVDNTSGGGTTGLMDDAEIVAKLKMGGSAPTGDIYLAVTSAPDGTLYGTPATGSDAGITLARTIPWDFLEDLRERGATGLRLPGTGMYYLGKIDCYGVASGATLIGTFGSIAAALGAQKLPEKWGIAVFNQTGAALDSTGGNHTIKYTGSYITAS